VKVKKSLVFILCLVVAISLVLVGCGGKKEEPKKAEQKKISIKMSVTTPSESSPWNVGAKKWAELVKQRTNGRVEITTFPNEQLSSGNQQKGIEQVAAGVTGASLHSTIIYSVIEPKLAVVSMPWIMPNNAAVDKAMKGAPGEKVKELIRAKGIEPLAFGENGFRHWTNSKRPLATPDDMKGLKIRVPGMKMYIALFKAMGADPTSMSFSEVFTALQQGTVDGQENPISVIYTTKLNEVQKYMTICNYSYDPIVLGVNKKLWDSIDKETQDIMKKAAIEAMELNVKLTREDEAKQLDEMKKKGLQVNVLTPEQIKVFQASVTSVYKEQEPIIGKDLLDLFVAAGK
jgi:tripartite ATP-independent transporter DctP family solute receptor